MPMDIRIEPFSATHAEAVLALFVDTLSSHYGGDHLAHFRRLMDAYDNGNVDDVGYNSTRQIGVVAVCAETSSVAGFLNYVVKRHGTAKISPLIVDPTARGAGVGRHLLEHMYQSLSDTGVRNVYCTVDKLNRSASAFFTRQGFQVLGESRDQYLKGHCELILQRSVIHADGTKAADRVVLMKPQTPEHWDAFDRAAQDLSLNETARHSISEIREAAERRPDDVDSKPKIVYVAHRGNAVVGALVLCPKKGGSLKVSTAYWVDESTLEEILAQLESVDEFLTTDGRVYVHMPMESHVVQVMQTRGWRLDAIIPGVESDSTVAGQWSTSHLDAAAQDRHEWMDYHLELQEMIRGREWNKFETPQELAISLMAEVGELAQELQWKSQTGIPDLDTKSIAAELADIYNYLFRLAWHLDIDMLGSCFDKLEKVKQKYPVALAKGNTRKYSELV